MPTYDFKCPNCGPIEIHHSIFAEHPDRCPDCGAFIDLQILTAVPVRYKGRGDIDGWTRQRVEPQEPTSPEANVPYS